MRRSQNLEIVVFSVKKNFIKALGGGGGYFGVKRIGMTIGNPRKLP